MSPVDSVIDPSSLISTILKHDAKQTSYKIALLRAINDAVFAFPDLRYQTRDIAIPLVTLADFWIAYYWPFVDPDRPILQGNRAKRDGTLRQDMAFRKSLTAFRQAWERLPGGGSSPHFRIPTSALWQASSLVRCSTPVNPCPVTISVYGRVPATPPQPS